MALPPRTLASQIGFGFGGAEVTKCAAATVRRSARAGCPERMTPPATVLDDLMSMTRLRSTYRCLGAAANGCTRLMAPMPLVSIDRRDGQACEYRCCNNRQQPLSPQKRLARPCSRSWCPRFAHQYPRRDGSCPPESLKRSAKYQWRIAKRADAVGGGFDLRPDGGAAQKLLAAFRHSGDRALWFCGCCRWAFDHGAAAVDFAVHRFSACWR